MTKSNLNLIYNFPSVSIVRDELSRKVTHNLASVIKVDVKCITLSRPSSECDDVESNILDINKCHAPLQLINSFEYHVFSSLPAGVPVI